MRCCVSGFVTTCRAPARRAFTCTRMPLRSSVQQGDGRHRAEARLAPQVLQHGEAVHPGEVQAEEEQVGRTLPRQETQSLQRLVETGDPVPLAPQDDLQDLARGAWELPFPLFGGPGRISQG